MMATRMSVVCKRALLDLRGCYAPGELETRRETVHRVLPGPSRESELGGQHSGLLVVDGSRLTRTDIDY